MQTLFRKVIIKTAGNRFIERFFRKNGMSLGANRYVAAESLHDAVVKVKELNQSGRSVTLDYLGESVYDLETAESAAFMILATCDKIRKQGLNAGISVKLTQLGLLLGDEACLAVMNRIMDKAEQDKHFVRIDMEDSSVTDRTIKIFKHLLARYGPERIGLVLQSYLYRSGGDERELGSLGANLRIVKGAYSEPPSIAFAKKSDVDRNYELLVKNHITRGCYTAVATHDQTIIRKVCRFVESRKIPRNRFEFQMLYGIAETLQLQLVKEGYRVRVYTPFGREWYPYFTRRMAERPANFMFVLKHLLRR